MNIRDRLLILENDLSRLEDEIESKKESIDNLDSEIRNIENAKSVLSGMVKSIIDSKKGFMESVINDGLNFIFGKNYRVEIKNDFKNNKNLWFLVVKDGDIEGDIDSFGGGVMSVISFLIRLSINIMTDRKRFMFLDESFNHLSSNYHGRLVEFLKFVSKKYNYIIVLVTHQQSIIDNSEKIVLLDKVDGKLVTI